MNLNLEQNTVSLRKESSFFVQGKNQGYLDVLCPPGVVWHISNQQKVWCHILKWIWNDLVISLTLKFYQNGRFWQNPRHKRPPWPDQKEDKDDDKDKGEDALVWGKWVELNLSGSGYTEKLFVVQFARTRLMPAAVQHLVDSHQCLYVGNKTYDMTSFCLSSSDCKD